MNFLKFTSETSFKKAFDKYMVEDIDGTKRIPSYVGTSAVDVVGAIFKPTGKVTETEFGPVQEMTQLKGFHVNFSGDVPEDLQKFIITAPDTPSRVFA